MKVHFINVGYGDSVLLEIPDETDSSFTRVLIDTGSAKTGEYPFGGPRIMVTDYLKQKAIHRIEVLILSHPHEDHIAMAIPLMKQVEVGEVWVNHLLPESSEEQIIDSSPVWEARFLLDSLNIYTPIQAYCREKGIPLHAMANKDKPCQISETLNLKILNNQTKQGELFGQRLFSIFDQNGNVPTHNIEMQKELIQLNETCNASSLALLFQWKGKRILLTGDSCPESWPEALYDELSCQNIDLFKLPHHGQRDSISIKAVKAVSPRIIVTSSASDRRNYSSHPDCYHLIREHMPQNPQILFTDEVKYSPFFEAPGPFRALIITFSPEQDETVDFDLCSEPETANSRAEVLL